MPQNASASALFAATTLFLGFLGGVIGIHTHKDRPTVSYFLQGEVVFHQADKPDLVIHPSEGFAEGKATTHWAENRGSVPAVWIAADIPRAP